MSVKPSRRSGGRPLGETNGGRHHREGTAGSAGRHGEAISALRVNPKLQLANLQALEQKRRQAIHLAGQDAKETGPGLARSGQKAGGKRGRVRQRRWTIRDWGISRQAQERADVSSPVARTN